MKRYEFEITKHPAGRFTHLVYFCSPDGECSLDRIPSDQTKALTDLLNEKGSAGWDLVQTLFGKDGIVIIWKREI